MPSIRKAVGYRPDPTEEALLKALAEKLGLPTTRVIGLAVRQLAEQHGIKVLPQGGVGVENLP